MASSTTKMIVLKSLDGHVFEVEEVVALESQTMRYLIEDGCVDNGIPLPNVTGAILAKVVEYCKRHAEAKSSYRGKDCDLKEFDESFLNVDRQTLFDLFMAANYLEMKSLLDLTCQSVADEMEDMSPEEIRNMFYINNEEEEVQRDNSWAFA